MSEFARLMMTEYLMYLRKSRKDDPNESVEEVMRKHEIQLQDLALRRFGYRIPEKDIYREVVSGETIDDRPQIQELFRRMEKENIKGVLVIEPERLSRGDLLDCGTVVHAFRYTDTQVVTLMKTYDLSDKFDRKSFESELIRGNDFLEYTKEILHRGIEASKRRGNFVGSAAPYGYDRIKIGKDWTLKPNEKEAPYIKMMYELYADGCGAWSIANEIEALGARPRVKEHFTEGVIRQLLSNPVYVGKIRISERSTVKVLEDGKVVKKRVRNKNYEIVEGKHEPLVSQELFDKVQARRGLISRENPAKPLRNMYAGLMKCAVCGGAVEMAQGSHKNKEQFRFRCKDVRNCDNMSHNIEPVHEVIVDQLKAHLVDFEFKVEANNQGVIKDREALLDGLKKQLLDVTAKQEAICEYLETGVYSVEMFVSRNNKLSEDKARIEEAIKSAEIEIPSMQAMKEQLHTFHQTLDMLDDPSISAKVKNVYLKKIVKVIYYKKDENGISLEVILR